MVTVDIVLFTIRKSELCVMLIRRLIEPFVDQFAIPGGFVLPQESLPDAARRELFEETGYRAKYLEQLFTFGDPQRDPRGRVVTVAYFALVPEDQSLAAGSDASEVGWFPVSKLPALAFDHAEILRVAHDRLKAKLDYSDVGFRLLSQEFSLTDLQEVHETILGHPVDPRNFRRKLENRGVVKETDHYRQTGRKPARLYRFSGEGALPAE
jgi:8-oxo-dGTP diphosphatase